MKSSNTDLRSQDGVTLKVYIHNLRHKRASALQAEICNFKITLSYKFVHILFVHFRSKDGFFFFLLLPERSVTCKKGSLIPELD